MSLFGSLFTGVSGLSAQSQATAMISNNIANVSTVGFKRSEASFFSLVTSESRSSLYSPGTVAVNRVQRVDQQGPIQQTASSTDAAISGNGLFIVKRSDDNLQEFLYTRSGSFSEDSQGILRNTAGFVLFGWPLDSNGNLPANQGDLTSLVAVDVAFLGGLTRPTSAVELSINLDADTVDDTLAGSVTAPVDFTRGVTVFDTLGSAQTLTFEFKKTYGPQGTAAGSISDINATDNLITDIGLTDGDQFTISDEGGLLRTIDINTLGAGDIAAVTVSDIINDINTNVAGVSAFLGNDGELVIQRDDFVAGTEDLILENTIGTPFTGLGITLAAGPNSFPSNDLTTGAPATYDNGDPTDTPPYSSEEFPAFQFLPGDAGYNSRGWWQVNILHPDGTSLNRGLLNYNGDGTLNALQDSNGNIDIGLTNINWNNGSQLQNISVDVERFSQFAGNFDVIFSDQDGAELGLRTGVSIDRDGFVIAEFSNGASTELYKLPLATFANPNGLGEVSGTAYSETEQSGEENLREAGTGGAGFLEASTVEVSNVDLGDEFAKLIIAQRAFSANTRVINTVDQMTEELLRLR